MAYSRCVRIRRLSYRTGKRWIFRPSDCAKTVRSMNFGSHMQGIRRACYKGVVEYRPENGDKERGGENEKIKRFSGDIGMRILWSIKKRFQAFGLVRGGVSVPGRNLSQSTYSFAPSVNSGYDLVVSNDQRGNLGVPRVQVIALLSPPARSSGIPSPPTSHRRPQHRCQPSTS